MSNLSVTIAGVEFANPVIAASGTFGYGTEYGKIIDVSRLGGICSKGLTLEPRQGNTGIRLLETASGLINSIGLENPGIPHFVKHELKKMLRLGPVIIANLSGSTIETYVEGAKLLARTRVPLIELNISCPNVKSGGMAWGLDPASAALVISAVKNAAPEKPLIVKLSPNAPDPVAVAKTAVSAGADALSLVNTFQAFSVNIETGEPFFDNITAGLSGPAIKPIALRILRDIVLGVPECAPGGPVPVIGLGGISTWQDAVEFIMTGASAVQVGTATFARPHTMTDIIDGLSSFMDRKRYPDIPSMRGIAL
ncbi:dihydroorotate dehydrogenase [Brucepastera parasyntrophica]|uniref:dihydroorotate dehydrogenase n=1 Tax=Brucepastera parasyntrophica TaxID=2880008 RepID=UPI00210D0687|nr:dihydroorotate dehydrogenase [Brucepastera parasyntrophica]ULQ60809.1 dihydroorotate dehydrogenase [Brucepastera parasyntrophica]